MPCTATAVITAPTLTTMFVRECVCVYVCVCEGRVRVHQAPFCSGRVCLNTCMYFCFVSFVYTVSMSFYFVVAGVRGIFVDLFLSVCLCVTVCVGVCR